MKTVVTGICFVVALGIASAAYAQSAGDSAPAPAAQVTSTESLVVPKDPLVAMYLSATLPGLGQIYAGRTARGILFMASVLGAFGGAYAAYKPADLALADYDAVRYGGNGDGFISTVEAQNWQDRAYQDAAFERLSDGRKAGVIAGAAVGASLYIWNVLNARHEALEYNRELSERRVHMALDARPGRVGLAVGMNF
jgi:TM2 domain-containing membrane protein YozV